MRDNWKKWRFFVFSALHLFFTLTTYHVKAQTTNVFAHYNNRDSIKCTLTFVDSTQVIINYKWFKYSDFRSFFLDFTDTFPCINTDTLKLDISEYINNKGPVLFTVFSGPYVGWGELTKISHDTFGTEAQIVGLSTDNNISGIVMSFSIYFNKLNIPYKIYDDFHGVKFELSNLEIRILTELLNEYFNK